MNHLTDLIKSFELRTEALRTEIVSEIINLLKTKKIQQLYLTEHEDNLAYVVWFDDDCIGYDCVVKSVSIDGDSDIELEIYHHDFDSFVPVSSKDTELACTNVDWLVRILHCVHYTLSLPDSKGELIVEGKTIIWSYKEKGLTELPERELQEIEQMVKDGHIEGTLFYNDCDADFAGEWKIKTE